MAEVQLQVTGMGKLLKKMKASTKEAALTRGMFQSALFLARWSKNKKMRGPRPDILAVVTGRLRSSIAVTRPVKHGGRYTTKIGSNVKYARIHELGGMAGRNRSARIPKRPYLRPALEDRQNQNAVVAIITRIIEQSMEKA